MGNLGNHKVDMSVGLSIGLLLEEWEVRRSVIGIGVGTYWRAILLVWGGGVVVYRAVLENTLYI